MNKYKEAMAALLGALLMLGQASAQQFESFEDFQERSEDARVQDPEAHRQQLETFRNNPDQQEQLLEAARERLAEAEARSTELENAFDENQLDIENTSEQLTAALGPLNELVGVLQQISAEAANRFETSLTSIQFPERTQFLNEFALKLSDSYNLPEIAEIERLWFELLREATELGKVKRLTDQAYVTADGQQATADVVRIGPFNVVTDGAYLQYNPASNSISALQRQPGGRFVESASALLAAQPGDGVVGVGLDPSGRVLTSLVDTATWRDQIEYGGAPGYVILALGLFAVLLSIERLITLGIASAKVRAQLKRDTPSDDNPLGRVLQVYEENQNVDTETLELKLSEAVLRETPSIQRGVLLIKIISVLAPLLGLLGTVMGMIQTFESITLFGTGDPGIMAGGISQALVTTQFGLMVAIPAVLLHTIVNGRARSIIQTLQEKTTGLIATHAEKTHSAPRTGG